MSYQRKRSSKLATLDAARTIFFIIVGLAIAQSLGLFAHDWPPWTMLNPPEGWNWPGRFLIGFGYLVTVLRFSHGVSQLCEVEKDAILGSRPPSSARSLMLYFFLSLLGILFYLMADNITNLSWYLAWAALMSGVDFVYIASSGVVHGPLRRLILWAPGRLTLYKRRKENDTDRIKSEGRLINTLPGYVADAAIAWMIGDVFVIAFCFLFFRVWNKSGSEYWFASVLILAAIADYAINREFYFGGKNDRHKKKIIFICSPLAGTSATLSKAARCDYYRENIRRAQFYCKKLMEKEHIASFASHAFYTYFLNNNEPADRILGRYCALAFLRACSAIYVYLPYTRQPLVNLPLLRRIKFDRPNLQALASSSGMQQEINEAKKLGLRIRYERAVDPGDWQTVWEPISYVGSASTIKQNRLEVMKRVYVCTRLRGLNYEGKNSEGRKTELEENIKQALWECFQLVHDENDAIAPFAPQALYPYFLPMLKEGTKWDNDWFYRSLEVLKICDALYVYTEDGLPNNTFISKGMTHVIKRAEELGMEIQYRPLSTPRPNNWTPALPKFEQVAKVSDLPEQAVHGSQLGTVPTQGAPSQTAAGATSEPAAEPAGPATSLKKTCIYFAAPLFTQGEWQWNIRLADELKKLGIDVILPQDEAYTMLKKERAFDARALFLANTSGIDRADLVLAILDQADPDSGTCWECGYAYKVGCPVLGLRTDIRTTGDAPGASVNLMLPQSCKEFLEVPLDKRDDVPWVAALIVESIRRIIKPAP